MRYLVLAAFVVVSTSTAAAQYAPPEQRRAARDELVEGIGIGAAGFVKRHGEFGIAALRRCSLPVGKRLVASEAALGSFPDGGQALVVAIAYHGDAVACWALDRQTLLSADPVAYTTFCGQPKEYAFDLADLAADAARIRQSRQGSAAPSSVSSPFGDPRVLAALGAAALAAFLLGKRRGKSGRF